MPVQLSRLSVFRKSHVASFQGRVACSFYPWEGLHIPLSVLHTFLMVLVGRNQDILYLVIISFNLVILVTCMFDQVGILKGEIRCLSLLGLKGLTRAPRGGVDCLTANFDVGFSSMTHWL